MSSAPAAPARLGEPVEAQAARTYLGELNVWITERRAELDELDSLILASPEGARLTNDMVLSLSVWQAAKNRYDLLLATWDSGRVGPQQLDRMSSLIWGRLDDTLPSSGSPTPASAAVSGLSVSLPEACRLSDALAAQLRSKLMKTPGTDQMTLRLRDLRAQLERLRDQVRLEPPASRDGLAATVSGLAARADDLGEKLARGGDIGGTLGPLEIQAATLERDLIVGGTKRRQASDKLSQARELREALALREAALTDLVTRAVTSVVPAPKYAVPQVGALGPVPSSASALDGYLARLGQVSNAMQVVQDAYSKALDSHAELAGRLEAVRAQAHAKGLGQEADLAALGDLVERFLGRRPSPVGVVETLLAAYSETVSVMTSSRGAA